MDDIYMVSVLLTDNTKKIETVTARNDLKAIDKVYKHYTEDLHKDILDIKII